jgi:hypothetical protein
MEAFVPSPTDARIGVGRDGRFHGGMDAAFLEGLAVALYTRLKLDPSRPVSTFALARKHLLIDVSRPTMMIGPPARTFLFDGQRRIAVKKGLPVACAQFFCGHELGHMLLEEEGYDDEDTEACCDYLAAALVAPRPAIVSMQRTFGFDLASIAAEVGGSQTWAALRVGEVLRVPIAVIAPTVRVRGPEEWVWPDHATLRRWSSGRVPKGLARARLTDDRDRVVLTVDELAVA